MQNPEQFRYLLQRPQVRDIPPERLRWLRQTLGISQAKAASWLGVTVTTWARWERGERRPDVGTRSHLAYVLRVVESRFRPIRERYEAQMQAELQRALAREATPVERAARALETAQDGHERGNGQAVVHQPATTAFPAPMTRQQRRQLGREQAKQRRGRG